MIYPVVATEILLELARVVHRPLFRCFTAKAKLSVPEAIPPKASAESSGHARRSEGKWAQNFAGHPLRAGLASSTEVDEHYVQKQLGHASAEMTRKYQRHRDQFRVSLS